MAKTKRLVDLYTRGVEVAFEDPDGGPPLVVWLKKPQPFELDIAMNRANQQRAKVLTLKRLPRDHDEVVLYDSQIDELFESKDDIINFVAAEDLGKALRSVESEVAFSDDWSKDDYLEGLQDSWSELEIHYYSEDDPAQHEEALRVFDELKRFRTEVEEKFEKKKAGVLREYEDKSDTELREIALERLIDMRADMRWIEEFKRSQIWLAVKDNKNRRESYFVDRHEVDLLDSRIYGRLLEALDALTVAPEEGKD